MTANKNMKEIISQKATEIMNLLQGEGYDAASIEIRADPAAYLKTGPLVVHDSFDWTPSWTESTC